MYCKLGRNKVFDKRLFALGWALAGFRTPGQSDRFIGDSLRSVDVQSLLWKEKKKKQKLYENLVKFKADILKKNVATVNKEYFFLTFNAIFYYWFIILSIMVIKILHPQFGGFIQNGVFKSRFNSSVRFKYKHC